MKVTVKQLKKFIREQLAIKTKTAKSSIPDAGKGLFSGEDVKAGQLVSIWNNNIDKIYHEKELDGMSSRERNEFEEYASLEDDKWYLSGDECKYMNHSDDPNIGVLPGIGPAAKRERIAVKNISSGEELTIDYDDVGTDGI